MRLSRQVFLWIGTLAMSAVLSPGASAQELEPNNLCIDAQEAGTLVPPAVLTGSTDAASATVRTDVDFFRFTAAPGLALRLMGGFNQRIGLFSEGCVFQIASDGSFGTPFDFTVPDSGTFILAVGDRFDNQFNGLGFFNDGPYTLSISVQPPKIGSISGRLVDAVSMTPLVGNVAPFARLELRRCNSSGSCFDLVANQNADAAGMFRFELDFRGRPIEVGSFQLIATADEFQQRTLLFSVDANQNLQVGNVALIPPPILFSNIRPCTAILPQGGTCQYSVAIRNNTTARLTGQALSIVTGGFGSTRFEASTQRTGTSPVRAAVNIPALGSRDVTFNFTVPSFVQNGTTVCTQLQLGLDPSPLFNVARLRDLFCINKGSSGFTVMSADESRAVFDLMKSTNAPPAQPLK
jgi:hypothetical protein